MASYMLSYDNIRVAIVAYCIMCKYSVVEYEIELRMIIILLPTTLPVRITARFAYRFRVPYQVAMYL